MLLRERVPSRWDAGERCLARSKLPDKFNSNSMVPAPVLLARGSRKKKKKEKNPLRESSAGPCPALSSCVESRPSFDDRPARARCQGLGNNRPDAALLLGLWRGTFTASPVWLWPYNVRSRSAPRSPLPPGHLTLIRASALQRISSSDLSGSGWRAALTRPRFVPPHPRRLRAPFDERSCALCLRSQPEVADRNSVPSSFACSGCLSDSASWYSERLLRRFRRMKTGRPVPGVFVAHR